MKAQLKKETQNISTDHTIVPTIVELCAIRDGVANCDVMYCTEVTL